MIPPAGTVANQAELGMVLTQILQRIYQHGIRPDWWKLPPPDQAGWAALSRLIDQEAPHCRGVILLGLDAPVEQLIQSFRQCSAFPLCRGFAIGRTIFATASQQWLAGTLDDAGFQQQIRRNYRTLVQAWLQRHQPTSLAADTTTGASV